MHSARLPFPTHSTIAVILSRKSKISYGREKLQNILCSSYFNEFIFKKIEENERLDRFAEW